MKRVKCDCYRDARFRRNRRSAVLVLAALCMAIGFMAALVLDAMAERVCVTQLDEKAAWAVAWSREHGAEVLE